MFNEWLKWSQCIKFSLKTNQQISTTFALQPRDAGIVHSFKSHYRKLFVRHKLQLLEEHLKTANLLLEI